MNKQKKQFIILCVVLVAFIAVFFGLKAFTKYQEEKEAEKTEAEKITALTLEIDKTTEFSYEYGGVTITFVKEEDTWYYKDDTSISIVQSSIETMLSKVEEIIAEQQITDPEDISQYGFDEPQNVITLRVGEETVTVTIGMVNEITSQYYMMISGDDSVYLTDSTVYDGFQKSVADVTEEEEEEEETDESDESDTTDETDTAE